MRVSLLQGITSSREELGSALRRVDLPRARGGGAEPRRKRIRLGTKLYDAVRRASVDVMKPLHGRKALVLLTDGIDSGSRSTLAEALESAQRNEIAIYPILYMDHGKKEVADPSRPRLRLERGRRVLGAMALQTGGDFFEVNADMPVERILETVQTELRTQYSIGYASDRECCPGEYRHIQLSAIRPGGALRAREGYYAK